MDIVLICNVRNLYEALGSIYFLSLLSDLQAKYDVDIKLEYAKSRVCIHIMDGEYKNPMYIKRCKLDDVTHELKKIESI